MRTGVPDRAAADWSDGAERIRPDTPRSNDRSTDDLARRLESLPDGHPSSPYDANGTRRDSPTRLRDLDTDPDPGDDAQPDKPRPYTDAEWADHRAEVPARLETAREDGLESVDQFGLDDDGEVWTSSRREVHAAIIEELYTRAADVPCEHKAIIAGGLAGAGKTTVLADHAGIDRSQYLTVNPDDIKVELGKRDLIPKVEGLSPMEASDLVHLESSHIAKQLALRARADGKNLIWDITMASPEGTEKRISDLRADGYTSVSGIFVDIPIDVSLARADARHREGEDDYRLGKGLGGRYVPQDFITSQADADWGSQNRRTFEAVKPRLDQWALFDNGVDGRDPVRIAEEPSPRQPSGGSDMTSEVTELMSALRDGTMSLNEVAQRFRARTWPRRARPRPTSYLELAAQAQEDPEPDIPGSFDEVTAALYRGEISDDDYEVLAQAMAASKRAEDGRRGAGAAGPE